MARQRGLLFFTINDLWLEAAESKCCLGLVVQGFWGAFGKAHSCFAGSFEKPVEQDNTDFSEF